MKEDVMLHEPWIDPTHDQDPKIRDELIAERSMLMRKLWLDVKLELSTWAAAREMKARVIYAARETAQARLPRL